MHLPKRTGHQRRPTTLPVPVEYRRTNCRDYHRPGRSLYAVKIYYLKVSGHKSPSADRIQLFQHSETITILSQGTLIDKIQLLSLNGKMIHSQSIVSEKFTFQKENLIQSMSILRVYLIDGSIRSFKVF